MTTPPRPPISTPAGTLAESPAGRRLQELEAALAALQAASSEAILAPAAVPELRALVDQAARAVEGLVLQLHERGPAAPSTDRGREAPPPRVLLADEDDLTASVIEHRLSRAGAEVARCPDGVAALSLLQGQPFALAVLGANLPGLDGFELVRQIRTRASLAHLPTVLVDWGNNEQNIARAFDLGADDYLTKPFSLVELTARLQRLLRRPAPPPVSG